MSSKNKIIEAVELYSQRQRRLQEGPKRRNNKPEDAVVKAHLDWYKANDFFIARYESKAKMQNGVWRASGLNYGTPDLMGCDSFGQFHALEAKAPGRLSTLREEQRAFLLEIIERGGFGMCSDNVDKTVRVWNQWCNLYLEKDKVELLKSILPAAKRPKECEF